LNYHYQKDFFFQGPNGEDVRFDEVPSEFRSQRDDLHDELVEHLVNADDAIGEMFLEEKTPTDEDIQAAIRRATIARKFTPVLVGSALKNKGVQPLLNAVIDYLPNPTQVPNFALDSTKMVVNEEGEEMPTKIRMDPERSDKKPFVGLAFKLEQGKFGQLTYLRAYQGTVKKGDSIYNTRTGKKSRIPRLVQMHADKMEDVNEAKAGDISALFGIDCASGDTFVLDKNELLSMESIFVPDPVISLSIKPTDKKNGDNFQKAVQRFTKEDPTFRITWDDDVKETIAQGMGELHLEIYAQRMEREYACPVTLGKPRVAFRETLYTPKVNFDYWHRKQSGGRGEYARVIGYMEALPSSSNTTIEFKDKTVGTNIPKNFIPAIRKAFEQCCQKGALSGHRVVGVRMVLLDGAHHEVDSSDWAFHQATQHAFEECFEDATWMILEPVMSVEVTAPEEFQGACVSLLTARNGVISNIEGSNNWFTLEGEAPLNDMFGFASDLRSRTQGKGEYAMEYARYSPALGEVQEKVIKQYQASLNQGDASKAGKKSKKN